MVPQMKPALRRGWRDLNTVQFGMTPAHALTLGPMDTATGSFLDLLNGTRGLALLREEGRRMDLPEGHVDTLVGRLARAGLVDDARGGGPDADALRGKKEVLDRLAPDLASLSLTTSEPGDAMRLLAARRSLRVQVRGAGRVGVVLAALLSGAGVGEVDVRDSGQVEPWDVAPGGLPAGSVGDRRDTAARRAVSAAAPGRAPRSGSGPRPGWTTPGSPWWSWPRGTTSTCTRPPRPPASPSSGPAHLICTPVWSRPQEWSALSSCRARRAARAVCTRHGPTATRPGPGWSPSGVRAADGFRRGPVTWHWPLQSPDLRPRTRSLSWTAASRRARAPAGRSRCPV